MIASAALALGESVLLLGVRVDSGRGDDCGVGIPMLLLLLVPDGVGNMEEAVEMGRGLELAGVEGGVRMPLEEADEEWEETMV